MVLTNVPKVGPSFDFYSRLTITTGTFNSQPDAVIPFSSQGLMFVLETGSAAVEISFDGKTVHARLDSTVTNGMAQKYTFNNRVNSLVWFRVASGSNPVVQTMAWGIR